MKQKSFPQFLAFVSDNRKPVPSINSGQALSQAEGSKTSTERRRNIQNSKWMTVVVLAVAFALCGAVAEAQQPGKIFRIGFLDSSTASGMAVLIDPFRQETNKLGWIEGKNVTIEYRFAEQRTERLPELAVDLVGLKVDLIVVTSTQEALAAKRATTSIPIVMTNVGDPWVQVWSLVWRGREGMSRGSEVFRPS